MFGINNEVIGSKVKYKNPDAEKDESLQQSLNALRKLLSELDEELEHARATLKEVIEHNDNYTKEEVLKILETLLKHNL